MFRRSLYTTCVHIWNANNAIIKKAIENRVSAYSVNQIDLSRSDYIIFFLFSFYCTFHYIILYYYQAHSNNKLYYSIYYTILYSGRVKYFLKLLIQCVLLIVRENFITIDWSAFRVISIISPACI